MSIVLISPFSNSDIRDWPLRHFREVIRLLLTADEHLEVQVVGTAAQRVRANEIVREFDATRVHNRCGRMSWDGLLQACAAADCVVANNSGVAHAAAQRGARVICLFGGSHRRAEWRPIGAVTLLSPVASCSPCHLDHGAACPVDKACLLAIAPQSVARAVLAAATSSRRGSQYNAGAVQERS